MKGKTLGCFIKVLIVIIIISVLILLFTQFSGVSCIKKIDKTLPSLDKASWEVTTPMKLYYAETVNIQENESGIISADLFGWYEQFNGKWVYHKDKITLERRLYGMIEVKRRIGFNGE